MTSAVTSRKDLFSKLKTITSQLEVFCLVHLPVHKAQLNNVIVATGTNVVPKRSPHPLEVERKNSFKLSKSRYVIRSLIVNAWSISVEIRTCEISGLENPAPPKPLCTKETKVFVDLMKWGMKAIQIFSIRVRNSPSTSQEGVQLILRLSALFDNLCPLSSREIFINSIGMMVEQCAYHSGYLLMVNLIIKKGNTSTILCPILLSYVMERLKTLEEDSKISKTYQSFVKFIMLAAAVYFPENLVPILKPYIRNLVRKPMEYIKTSENPVNYLTLLNAVFKLIGHSTSTKELLEQIIPIFPDVLKDFIDILTTTHRPLIKMKILEFSIFPLVHANANSLVPYLPQLNYMLVCAFHTSATPEVVTGALKVLETCVHVCDAESIDRLLQPDLTDALWKLLRGAHRSHALTVFRIIGKLGGASRKVHFQNPQRLSYGDNEEGFCLKLQLSGHETPLRLQIGKVINTVVKILSGDVFRFREHSQASYCKTQAWNFLKTFTLTALSAKGREQILSSFHFAENKPGKKYHSSFVSALVGCLMAAEVMELKKDAYLTIIQVTRHFISLFVLDKATDEGELNPTILFDALAKALSYQYIDLRRPVMLVLSLVVHGVEVAVGSKRKIFSLPMMEYLTNKLCELCYGQSLFSKWGGCEALKFLIDICPRQWTEKNISRIFKAMIHILSSIQLTISASVLSLVQEILRKLIELICTICSGKTILSIRSIRIEKPSCLEFIESQLFFNIFSPAQILRQECMKCIELMKERSYCAFYFFDKTYIHHLKKRLSPLGQSIREMPVQHLIGLLDGTAFFLDAGSHCKSFNWSDHEDFMKDVMFFGKASNVELIQICKDMNTLVSLKKAVFKVLSCFSAKNLDVIELFSKQLEFPDLLTQEVCYESFKKFLRNDPISTEIFAKMLDIGVSTLEHGRKTNFCVLSNFCQLFPLVVQGSIIQKLVELFRNFIGGLNRNRDPFKKDDMIYCTAMFDMFMVIVPQIDNLLLHEICSLCLQGEESLSLSNSKIIRSLLLKFIGKRPEQFVNIVFAPTQAVQPKAKAIFISLLIDVIKHPDSKCVRDILIKDPARLNELLNKNDGIQYFAVRIIQILNIFDDKWLYDQMESSLFASLKMLWASDSCQALFCSDGNSSSTPLPFVMSQPGTLVAEVILCCVERNINDFETLFQLLRPVFLKIYENFPLSFHLVAEFLENTLPAYPLQWHKQLFQEFVKLFKNNEDPIMLANLINHVIIPCFARVFQNGHGHDLVKYLDTNDDILSLIANDVLIFVNKSERVWRNDYFRISLCKLCSLLVDQGYEYIEQHLEQSMLKQKLIMFGWSNILNISADSSSDNNRALEVSYYGHLLLAYIFSRCIVDQNMVIQALEAVLRITVPEAITSNIRVVINTLSKIKDVNLMFITWIERMKFGDRRQRIKFFQMVITHWKAYFNFRKGVFAHVNDLINDIRGSFDSAVLAHRITTKSIFIEVVSTIIKLDLEERSREIESQDSMLTDRDSGYKGVLLDIMLKMACLEVKDNSEVDTLEKFLSQKCQSRLNCVVQADMWKNQINNADLNWMNSILSAELSGDAAFNKKRITLEVFTLLTRAMTVEVVLKNSLLLRNGIMTCIASCNHPVITAVCNLLVQLVKILPLQYSMENALSSSNSEHTSPSFHDQMRLAVQNNLKKYLVEPGTGPEHILGTLIVIKLYCSVNPQYLDDMIVIFVRCLEKLTQQHFSMPKFPNEGISILMDCLKLLKNRVGMLGDDLKRRYIGGVLVELIDKSKSAALLETVVAMVDEWIVSTDPIVVNQGPNYREKSLLFVKLLRNIEMRFPEQHQLAFKFLNIVYFVYSHKWLKQAEFATVLEKAFFFGLRSQNPELRSKFFLLWNNSISKCAYDRLKHIVCGKDWSGAANHYWIPHCIELLLNSVVPSADVNTETLHAGFSDYIDADVNLIAGMDDSDEAGIQAVLTRLVDNVRREVDFNLLENSNENGREYYTHTIKLNLANLLHPLAKLCCLSISLAEDTWINFLPQVWGILSENERREFGCCVQPFLLSRAHLKQNLRNPSSTNTFLEGLVKCRPVVPLQPRFMNYVAKTYNLWHRMTLNMEYLVVHNSSTLCIKSESEVEKQNDSDVDVPDLLINISNMYSLLKEDDLWGALWESRTQICEVAAAVSNQLQGNFTKAQTLYESAMVRVMEEDLQIPAWEVKLMEEQWLKCAQKLNQWEAIEEYSGSNAGTNPFLKLEAAWRSGSWTMSKTIIDAMYKELVCPKELIWRFHIIQGYTEACSEDSKNLKNAKKHADFVQRILSQFWKKLPNLVTSSQVEFLHASQQVMELQEAITVFRSVLDKGVDSIPTLQRVFSQWKKRRPAVSDDLNSLADIFHFRALVLQFVVKYFSSKSNESSEHMVILHKEIQSVINNALAQEVNCFYKSARHQGCSEVALQALSRIDELPKGHDDIFVNIKERVKCCLELAPTQGMGLIEEAHAMLESVDISKYSKERIADFLNLKGCVFSQMNLLEDANKAFSASCQADDSFCQAWGHWGDYLEACYLETPQKMSVGVEAVTAFLMACQHNKEARTRKYIASVVAILMNDDDSGILSNFFGEKKCSLVLGIQWLPWIPQLISLYLKNEGRLAVAILDQLFKLYPQAVYFPVMAAWWTLHKDKSDIAKVLKTRLSSEEEGGSSPKASSSSAGQGSKRKSSDQTSLEFTRCSKILDAFKKYYPMMLYTLQEVIKQIIHIEHGWREGLLKQLYIGLEKCYEMAFENRNDIRDYNHAKLEGFVRNLVNFGESLPLKEEDSRLKSQFIADFSKIPSPTKLLVLIEELRKWITILCFKNDEEKRLYNEIGLLRTFRYRMASIILPGEFLAYKLKQQTIKIADFEPVVEIVTKPGYVARRIRIRGDNGKVYPYMISSESAVADRLREDHILQLFHLLNDLLAINKATAERYMKFAVARSVPINHCIRLVEDNQESVSLLEIFGEFCSKQKLEYDFPVVRYYENLVKNQNQQKTWNDQLLDCFMHEIYNDIQTTLIPSTILKNWAWNNFHSASDFWMFRKMFTNQLCLGGFMDYVFHLNGLNPRMINIHQNSGLVAMSYLKFDIDSQTGELNSRRAVPFRLTPNISEFMTPHGVNGPMLQGVIALSKCLSCPKYKMQAILRVIVGDEMASFLRRKQDAIHLKHGEAMESAGSENTKSVASLAYPAVKRITSRLIDLSATQVSTLVASASKEDNLHKMDPTWYPWL